MKKQYHVIRNVIKLDMCNFLTQYFMLKRQVKITYDKCHFISPYNREYGIFHDPQCLGAWSHYGDVASDLAMQNLKPTLEKVFKKQLDETYSYVRIYEKGHELKRHKDRSSCQISATINLGGAEWPIYISKSTRLGRYVMEKGSKKYLPSKTKGEKVLLKPGDMLLYKGDKFEHWREPLEGTACVQMFIHFVEKGNKQYARFKYDGRPHLGLDAALKSAESKKDN